MLIKITHDESVELVNTRNGYGALYGDFLFRLKEGFSGLGIRYTHYYEKENILAIGNCHSNGLVHLICLSTGELRLFRGHHDSVRKIRIVNDELITSSWDCTIRLTPLKTLQTRLVLTSVDMGRCPFFNLTPDAKELFSFTYDSDRSYDIANRVARWSLANGQRIRLYEASSPQSDKARSGSIMIHKGNIYVCSDHGHFRIFDIETAEEKLNIHTNAHFRSMTSILHYDGLLLSCWNGYIYWFSTKTNKFEMYQRAHHTDILCMRVHPDPDKKDILFSSSGDGQIKVWSMTPFAGPLTLISTIDIRYGGLWSFVFINDRLVAGNSAGELQVYDISNLQEIKLLGRLVISADGYVAQLKNSAGMFYTTNLEFIDVFKLSAGDVIQGREADYLKERYNSLRTLRELFGIKDQYDSLVMMENKQIHSLPPDEKLQKDSV